VGTLLLGCQTRHLFYDMARSSKCNGRARLEQPRRQPGIARWSQLCGEEETMKSSLAEIFSTALGDACSITSPGPPQPGIHATPKKPITCMG